jgi:long-chain fatty acid transport protein
MVLKRSLLAASVAATLFTAGAAHAPNDSAMIIATNPAGITETGNQVNFDISWFHPVRKYEQTGPGTLAAQGTSGSNNFYIPELSASYAINSANSIGIAIYGNGGMNTDYPANAGSLIGGGNNGAYGPNMSNGQQLPAGVNLKQVFIAPTYGHKFMNGKLSVGASLLFARQTIQVKGLDNFAGFSTNPANMTGNQVSHSTGWGGKIGVLYHATDSLALAGSYQTKMRMSKFDQYSGLFAEGGKFDIPATWTVGAAFKVTPAWTLTADYQRINYSGVKAISNPSTPYLLGSSSGPGCAQRDTSKCLGGSNGAGFGWSDVNVVKLGAQWQVDPALQIRVGWNHGSNPVGSQDVVFNTLAPGIVKNHYTAGFTYAINSHQEISGAFMYAPTVSVSGPNAIPSALSGGQAPVVQTTISMKQYEATVGYAYKF